MMLEARSCSGKYVLATSYRMKFGLETALETVYLTDWVSTEVGIHNVPIYARKIVPVAGYIIAETGAAKIAIIVIVLILLRLKLLLVWLVSTGLFANRSDL